MRNYKITKMVIIVAEKLVVNTETSKKRQRELVHLSQG
jgi:hypothetical protein